MDKSNNKNVHTMIGPDAIVNGPIRLTQGLIIYGKIRIWISEYRYIFVWNFTWINI